jgi:hypothetical protein
MFTAQDIFNFAMDLISKRSPNGTIDAGKTASYRARSLGLLTLWQNMISRTGNFYSTFEFDSKPIPNLIGNGFIMREHLDQDINIEVMGSVKAYNIEADGPGIIYVEDFTSVWNTLATITIPSTVTSFTQYKALVTPTVGATKSRYRLSGPTYYKVINLALYSYPVLADRIPDYAPMVKHKMPDDFKSIDQIVNESPIQGYVRDTDFAWEGRNTLLVDYNYIGKVRVIYKPVPITITALAQTLQVDDIVAMSGSYYLASHLLLIEDPASASFFQQVFEELRIESRRKQPAPMMKIEDVYGVGSMGG